MQNLPTPQSMSMPFANNAGASPIPATTTVSGRASLSNGFPSETAIPVSQGGIPPSRLDMNSLGYLFTSWAFYFQCGGMATFDPAVSNAIGGYPLGARLMGTDASGNGFVVRSTIPNNTFNFLTDPSCIGNQWVYDMGTPNLWLQPITEQSNIITQEYGLYDYWDTSDPHFSKPFINNTGKPVMLYVAGFLDSNGWEDLYWQVDSGDKDNYKSRQKIYYPKSWQGFTHSMNVYIGAGMCFRYYNHTNLFEAYPNLFLNYKAFYN